MRCVFHEGGRVGGHRLFEGVVNGTKRTLVISSDPPKMLCTLALPNVDGKKVIHNFYATSEAEAIMLATAIFINHDKETSV